MLRAVVMLSAVICLSAGAPQNAANPPVQILTQSAAVNGDGTFSNSFETSDGVKVEQSGYIKPGTAPRSGVAATGDGSDDGAGDIQVIQGSFSYTAPDGTPINLKYVADETGFHPEGSHLPTPPPIPEAIQRSLSVLPDTSSSDSS
ncbi:endocuticle structural glycoprotein SgAbd-2-like [Periplaneta americana]|uniref:endocuticle structural glycoprotein SgAbd-2-like n=1 Tax=Periplaneta americana TaxID=6978 RepID=UPI0037E78C04